MTEEIKEILYKFDKILENYELDKKTKSFSVDSICHLFPYEMITIKNYITNLQKENEKYKKIFEAKERFSKIMPDDTDFIILSKADYDRQQEDIELTAIKLKSRNEKAVEKADELRKYIYNELVDFNVCGATEAHCLAKDLLNILEGGDE